MVLQGQVKLTSKLAGARSNLVSHAVTLSSRDAMSWLKLAARQAMHSAFAVCLCDTRTSERPHIAT